MKFTKMHGCGNDYVYVDCTEHMLADPSAAAIAVSDRHFGVGGDGLILICKADFRMAMYNADGSEGSMCGNGIRCVAKFVYDKGLTNKTTLNIETKAGIKTLELTVENVRNMPRHHPRCGTSFLFVVLVLSILLFSIVQVDGILLQMVCKLLLLPVLVGIAYEINRYVGRHDNPVTRFVTAPGLWLQNFTTNPPDDSMIEVGIASLKAVIPEKKGQDAW